MGSDWDGRLVSVAELVVSAFVPLSLVGETASFRSHTLNLATRLVMRCSRRRQSPFSFVL